MSGASSAYRRSEFLEPKCIEVFMEIKRAAILIGASQVGIGHSQANPLPGVDRDIERMVSFLSSDMGGAWEDHEIHIISNKPSDTIKLSLLRFFGYDYVFILVAGHGCHVVDKKDTHLQTRPSEYLGIKEMRTFAKRQVFVVDVCRGLVTFKDLLQERVAKAALSMSMDSLVSQRDLCRAIFNQMALQIPEGIYKYFSCSENQTAGDDGSGGVYTMSLLGAAGAAKKTSSLNEIHGQAKIVVYDQNYPQLPTQDVGRTLFTPPFVVCLR